MADTRFVTLLFCDLVASTELLTRIGEEANDRVRREFFAAMRGAIAAHNGTEVKTVGDQFMVAFRENVADAVACAVAMQRAVARLNERDPLLRLAIRAGLSAGDASAEEGDWFGTPVIEASRLEHAARPNQILVSDLVRGLVGSRGGHLFTSVGALDLKGFDVPLPASEVAWEPEPGLPSIPLPSGLDRSGPPFAGRQAELTALGRTWDEVVAGQRRLVLLSGERGIGRTRLAAEFAARVHSDNTIVLYGRSDQDRDIPYQPFVETLRWYTIAARPEALREQVGALGPELTRIVPALRNRLPELSEPRPADADTERLRLFEAVAGLFRAASEQAPVLLVLDGLEGATEGTLGLLRHLMEAPGTLRLLVLGLAGDAGGEGPWAEAREALSGLPATSALALQGLAAADIASIAGRLVGAELGTGGKALAERVRDETEGNPQFVAELLGRLQEAGGLDPAVIARTADGELPVPAREVFEATCPYMGLRAFEPEDAGLFFGREEVVGTLLSRLGSGRLLTVVGASGSGKSSLVRAGIVPAVRRGALPGSARWKTAIFTPGQHPLAELAGQLAAQTEATATDILRNLEADTRALDLSARQALASEGEGARLLLVVDQFEELFTLCRDPDERRRFVEALLHAVTVPGGRTSVIIAMRADFYGESAAYPGFAQALEASHALLGPMSEDELRSAIKRPAELAGLRHEAGLADLMLAEVGSEPGGLPLLSHALLETWKRRDGRTLTIAGYRDAGGVRGAIARTADAQYASLDPAQQALAAGLFVRLTELGEGTEDTRRRVAFREVAPEGPEGEAARAVIRALADARLLTTAEDTVEVAHEALIREWPRLRGWLDEDREGLRLHRHLTESAQAWEGLGRDQGELYRGSRLPGALDWVERAHPDLNPLEREFLEASRELHGRELRDAAARLRRLRMLLGGVAAALVVAVVAAGYAFVQQRRADDEAARAEDAARLTALQRDAAQAASTAEAEAKATAVAERERAEDQAEQAREARDEANETARILGQRALEFAFRDALEIDRSLGLLLAAEARQGEDSVTTRGHLQAALLDEPRLLGYLHGSSIGVNSEVAFSSDGALVANPGADGTVEFWDLLRREPSGDTVDLPETTTGFPPLAFSPDDKLLAAAGETRTILYDVATRSPVRTLSGGGSYPAFSPDGRILAFSLTDGGVALWDVATGDLIEELPAPPGGLLPGAIAFSPDGALLVAGTGGGGVAVWDVEAREMVKVLTAHGNERLLDVTFSSDGTAFATSGGFAESAGHGIAYLWDSATLERVGEVPVFAAYVSGLAFSPDGAMLATASGDGTVGLWDAVTGEPTSDPIDVRLGTLANLAISADGSSLAVASSSGTLAIFDLVGQQLMATRLPIVGGVPTFSPDRTMAYVQFPDGTWGLLDAVSLRPLGDRQPVPAGWYWPGAPFPFSPDSSFVFHASRLCSVNGPCEESSVQLWETASSEPVGEQFPANFCYYGFQAVAISTDGAVLAVGRCGGEIAMYDIETRQPLPSLFVPGLSDQEVDQAAILTFFKRHGRSLLVAGGFFPITLAVWDVTAQPPILLGAETEINLGAVPGLPVHPDGTLALRLESGEIELIDPLAFDEQTHRFERLQTFGGHGRPAAHVTFSPDGSLMLTFSSESLRLWDVASGEQIGDSFGGPFVAGTIAADGESFVAASYASWGSWTVWNIDPDYWEEQACLAAGRNLTRAEWAKYLPGQPYRATCERWPLAPEEGAGSE